jgi:hypothetical protein
VWELPFCHFVFWRIIIAIPAPIVAGILARMVMAFVRRREEAR